MKEKDAILECPICKKPIKPSGCVMLKLCKDCELFGKRMKYFMQNCDDCGYKGDY